MTSAGAKMAPHVPVLVNDVVAALALQAAKWPSTERLEQAVTHAPCSLRGRDE